MASLKEFNFRTTPERKKKKAEAKNHQTKTEARTRSASRRCGHGSRTRKTQKWGGKAVLMARGGTCETQNPERKPKNSSTLVGVKTLKKRERGTVGTQPLGGRRVTTAYPRELVKNKERTDGKRSEETEGKQNSLTRSRGVGPFQFRETIRTGKRVDLEGAGLWWVDEKKSETGGRPTKNLHDEPRGHRNDWPSVGGGGTIRVRRQKDRKRSAVKSGEGIKNLRGSRKEKKKGRRGQG